MNLKRSTAFVVAFRVVGLAGRAGAVVVLSRAMGPTEFGNYNLLIVTAALAAGMACLGVQHAQSHMLNTGRMGDRVALGNALVVALTTTAVASAAGYLLRDWLMGGPLSGLDPTLMALLIPLIFLLVLHSFVSTHLLARSRVLGFGLTSQGYHFLFLCGSLGLLLLTDVTLTSVAIVYIGVLTLTVLVGSVPLLLLSGGLPTPSWTMLKTALPFGLSVVAGNVLLGLMYRVDYLMLGNLRNSGEVGIYAVATTMAEVFILVPQALGSVLFPVVSRSGEDGGQELAAKSLRSIVALVVASMIVGVPVGFLLLEPVFGIAYVSARACFLLLLPGIVGMSMAYVLFQYFSGIGKPSYPAMILGGAVVINVSINLAVIPAFGANGAAFSSSVSYLFAGILGLLVFRRSSGRSFGSLLIARPSELRLRRPASVGGRAG